MNRRTKKREDGWYDINLVIDESVDEELKPLVIGEYVRHSLNKLGQLEDYEEKIEMPLVKFLEWQINNLIPYFVIEGKIKKAGHYHVYTLRNIIEVWDANLKKRFRFYYKDYGKTWALTREELL